MSKGAAVVGLIAMLGVIPALAAAPTVDQLVAGFEQARGGAGAWRQLQTLRMTGAMQMGEMTVPVSLEFKRPARVRLQFQVQGMTVVQAYDGEHGWSLAPFEADGKPKVMGAEEREEMIEMADFEGALAGYQQKQHQLTVDGEESVDGVPTWRIKVVKANGNGEMWWLAKDGLLAVRTASKRISKGSEVGVASTMADYREVDGLLFPFTVSNAIQRGTGSLQQVIVLEQVELDVDLPDSRFAMPAGAVD